jgi:hypothetical protein
MKIFSSGSCRLLKAINTGFDKVIPIHSSFWNLVGINFLGTMHNTSQHIQFIKYIKDEIFLPDSVLNYFLTTHHYFNRKDELLKLPIPMVIDFCGGIEELAFLSIRKTNIKKQFNECQWYIFEICSLKLYKKNGFDIHYQLTDNKCDFLLQTEEQLYADLQELRSMIPINKKILFQVHFRPNIIYSDENKKIYKREIIYNIVKKFCEGNENVYLYDPSIIIKNNPSIYDGSVQFTNNGCVESFKYIYNNYIVSA